MSALTRDQIVVACHPLMGENTYGLKQETYTHILRSELFDPLLLNSEHTPNRIVLRPERVKQAIKETYTREEIANLKRQGLLKDDALEILCRRLRNLEEMFHWFWRRVSIVRSRVENLIWENCHCELNNGELKLTLQYAS